MKKIFILFALLIAQFSLAQESFNHFTYKIYKVNNEESNAKLREFIAQESDTIDYEFIIDKNKGHFFPVKKINNSQGKKLSLNDVFVKAQGEFYYDFEEETYENIKTTLGQTFIIKIEKDSYNWEITDETSQCLLYTCKKAIFTKTEKGLTKNKEYKITVWFTEDYPMDISPFGLLGLKGLVTKIDFNGNTEVKLDKMIFKENQKEIKFPESGKRLSLIEYNELIDNQLERYRKTISEGVDKD